MKILKLQTQANTSAQVTQAALHFTAWRVDILLSAHSQPNKHYTSLHIQFMQPLTQQERSQQKHQRPCVLWFTGLSGAGKSTLATLTERALFAAGCHTFSLDGDRVRTTLCQDLGFSITDRRENIRRIGAAAKLFTESGLMVLTATISPLRSMRDEVRRAFAPGEFIEVFVDAPLAVCETRDPKGLYRKARAGHIADFTGIDSAYEPPSAPEIHLRTDQVSPEACVASVIGYLRDRGYLLQGE
jgi:adenylylsulfate kinase